MKLLIKPRYLAIGYLFISTVIYLYVQVPSNNHTLSYVIFEGEENVWNRVKKITNCWDRPMAIEAKVRERGDYWILYNYFMAEKKFKCQESITYTTHADYSFIDNLVPLMERWQGPISVAMYAPGTDFNMTLDSITFLRDCTNKLIKEYVTFHVYFNKGHVPEVVPRYDEIFNKSFNCSLPCPFLNVSTDQMYRNQMELLYPINVGRNVARETAQTHYMLPSDIELYPSLNIIPQFLAMIANNNDSNLSKDPKVFPLSVFEIAIDQQVPDNKTRLQEMLANGTAVPFHQKICAVCHTVPNAKIWEYASETSEMEVFHVAKRTGRYKNWEPFYIGTHEDPLYDERFTWEGRYNKLIQGYALCALDYNFLILNNAFLVHRPGIKVYKPNEKRDNITIKMKLRIKETILPEYRLLYGVGENCTL